METQKLPKINFIINNGGKNLSIVKIPKGVLRRDPFGCSFCKNIDLKYGNL